ncbi:MAG: sortase [Anaerolineae bacterium]
MSARCPHLGLEGNRKQVYLVSSSRHRCYVAGAPQRVAGAHQAGVCLTSAYRRCPRLSAAATRCERPARQSAEAARLEAVLAPQRTDAAPRAEAPSAPAPSAARPRYTDLKTAGGHGDGRRRRLTLTEGVVLGLGTCIILAVLFVGYAVFHRARVGPGMAAPAIAQEPAPAAALPTGTLVPTYTPTPILESTAGPTAEPASGPAPELVPTPLPEPALPGEASTDRPPATSPPTRLVLSSIGLDVPVRPVGVRTVGQGAKAKTVWADLPDAAAFHNTSAYPGNVGNTVINGHRDIYAAVFRHLDRVQVGDEIILYVDATAYPYQVTDILIVPETFATAAQRAENQRLIGYMPEERLTLVTCTPVGLATHRLLVIAHPPEQVAPPDAQAGSGAGQ